MSDALTGPLIVGGLLAGAWVDSGDRRGLFERAGILVGVASPLFSPSPQPGTMDGSGYVLDFGLDLAIGYQWQRTRLALFAIPTLSRGTLRSSAEGLHDREEVDDLSISVGVSVSLAF